MSKRQNLIALFAMVITVAFTTVGGADASSAAILTASHPAPPSGKSQTHTTYLPMSQKECAHLHQTHSEIPCRIIQTIHVGAAEMVPASAVPKSIRSKAGTAASNRWTRATGWTKLCGGHCAIWHSKVSTQYVYNGTSVWQRYVDCSDYGGVGYTVSIDWCHYWNNGGAHYYYMNMGDNITVSFVYKGSPISRGFWQRYNVSVNGNFWRCSSNGGRC